LGGPGEVAETLELRQVVDVGLVDLGRVRMRLHDPERRDHQAAQPRARVGLAARHRLAGLAQVLQVRSEDLVDHRFLRVEVVVQAPGQDADLVGELAHGGGRDALAREQPGSDGQDLLVPAHRLSAHVLCQSSRLISPRIARLRWRRRRG